jgi:hypothetical protein
VNGHSSGDYIGVKMDSLQIVSLKRCKEIKYKCKSSFDPSVASQNKLCGKPLKHAASTKTGCSHNPKLSTGISFMPGALPNATIPISRLGTGSTNGFNSGGWG